MLRARGRRRAVSYRSSTRFTDLNPHLSLCATWVDRERRERWALEATDPGWAKWTPSAPTCPHWYRVEDLERLAGAFLSHDREHKTVRLLRDFLAQFNGLTGTAKRKELLDASGSSARRSSAC